MLRFWLLIPAFAAALAAQQTDLPKELTLAKALEIALANSTNIRTAMAQLDQVTGRNERKSSSPSAASDKYRRPPGLSDIKSARIRYRTAGSVNHRKNRPLCVHGRSGLSHPANLKHFRMANLA